MLLTELTVDFASPVPVYEQIKKQVKQAIARRAIIAGEPLPSIRELAAFLKINPNTVARAYRDLSQENVIDGRAGVGFRVVESGVVEEEKVAMLRDEFLRFLERAVEMGFSQEQLKEMVIGFFTKEGR